MVTPVPGKRRKSSESLPSTDEAAGSGEASGGTAGAASTCKRARSAEESSSVSSALVIPNGVDTSKLPNGWEDIVRAELKACGVGADEEYRRQLEAYDSSDDEAGEPLSPPPPARKRMGYQRTAKHYRVTEPVAKVLLKIVDSNLENAGKANGPLSIFTDNDDRFVRQLIEKDLAGSGRTRVRKGFWEKIVHEQHFAGRGLTAKMLKVRRKNQIVKKKKSLSSDDAKESNEPFTDAEDAIIRDAVTRQIQESDTDKLPDGSWPSVIEAHSMCRDPQRLSKHWYYLKKKGRGMVVSEDLSSSNDAQATNNSHGLPFTCDGDDIIIKEAVKELREHGRLRRGFWQKVLENHVSLNRTPAQLSRRCSNLKSKGKINLSETSSSNVGGTVTSEQSEAIPTTDKEPSGVHGVQSHSDTVPHTEDLIVFPAYQATTSKYPPQTLVTYRPSSGKANIVGRVMEVGIYPSQDNLYVYTIESDGAGTGVQYERIPERYLEKR